MTGVFLGGKVSGFSRDYVDRPWWSDALRLILIPVAVGE
jgi:hypothetical protein